jgi:hypothetical protein
MIIIKCWLIVDSIWFNPLSPTRRRSSRCRVDGLSALYQSSDTLEYLNECVLFQFVYFVCSNAKLIHLHLFVYFVISLVGSITSPPLPQPQIGTITITSITSLFVKRREREHPKEVVLAVLVGCMCGITNLVGLWWFDSIFVFLISCSEKKCLVQKQWHRSARRIFSFLRKRRKGI